VSRARFIPRADGRVAMKVCCIASHEEAALAASYGADAIGLVSAMPSGPGPIDEARIAEIAHHAPPGVHRVLLTSLTHARSIAEQAYRCGADVVQLVDDIGDWNAERLREFLHDRALMPVIHVRSTADIARAQQLAAWADALLLDSGNPDAAVRELGGTGRTHDWGISRAIVESVAVPVFLAGGLRPHNVAAAVAAVGPFGVDVCSGLRTNGALDATKLSAFAAALAEARR
jgi:phosphoribosylanthranilate isomerase